MHEQQHIIYEMNSISWLTFLYCCTICLGFRGLWNGVRIRSLSTLHAVSKKAPVLLPTSNSDSVANFLEYSTEEHQRKFIQCNIIAVGEIDGQKYGVGYPVNMPVMLTYFDKNELKPVLPAHRDYEHLLDHVSLQLDENDLHLHKTAVVLTLEGEFDDEEFNQVDPFKLYQTLHSNKRRNQPTGQKASSSKSTPNDVVEEEEQVIEEAEALEEEAEEVSLEELMHSENISGLEEAYDASDFQSEEDPQDEEESGGRDSYHEADEREGWDDYDRNEEENVITRIEPVPLSELPYLPDAPRDSSTSFSYRKSTPSSAGDITSIDRPPPVFPEITEEDLVTEEDTKSLNRAHRRADKIMAYAEDVKLMGSFHFKKNNYHLVRLLEPIFLIGKKVAVEKGGDSYALLSQQETETVRPVLEGLLLERSKVLPENDNQQVPVIEDGGVKNTPRGSSLANREGRTDSQASASVENNAPTGGSYNKWQSQDSDRYRSDGNKHFARHSSNDKRRSQGGNDVRNGGKGSSKVSRVSHQLSDNGGNGNMRGSVKNNNQQDVDEYQYERAREKWQSMKTNTDRRR